MIILIIYKNVNSLPKKLVKKVNLFTIYKLILTDYQLITKSSSLVLLVNY